MLRFFSASFCSARFRLPGCFLVFFVSLVIFMFAPFLRCCLWFAVFVHFALNCSCLPLYQLLQRASEIASKFQVFFFLTVVFFQFFTSTWTILSNTLTMWFHAFAHKFHWHRNFIPHCHFLSFSPASLFCALSPSFTLPTSVEHLVLSLSFILLASMLTLRHIPRMCCFISASPERFCSFCPHIIFLSFHTSRRLVWILLSSFVSSLSLVFVYVSYIFPHLLTSSLQHTSLLSSDRITMLLWLMLDGCLL